MRVRKTETFESGDQSGDLKNRSRQQKSLFSSCKRRNEYFNENGGIRLQIVTCTFHKMLDFIVVLLLGTVQRHRPSKQTVSSCVLAATRLGGISLNAHQLHARGTVVA